MADLKLWSFALKHAAYLWNVLLDQHTKLSPLELISVSCVPSYTHLQWLHVWGCLTFVLDPRLQEGYKLPKWSPRSRLGCFLGCSTCHSSTVSRMVNLKTGSVTPQYHLVHDDWFSTVTNASSSTLHESFWNNNLDENSW